MPLKTSSTDSPELRPSNSTSSLLIHAVFLGSGVAAVIYQLVWQRVLLGIYGTNIESVTVVVTAFMLGLGFGSLAGGWVADRPHTNAPRLFALIELGIGLFGLVSIRLFHWAGTLTGDAGTASVWIIACVLLLVPTMLMGATLPILAAHATRTSGNVGGSVGGLYSVNALGGAVGAVLSAALILGAFGQQGSVLLAAGINVILAATISLAVRPAKSE